ncbi:peptidoglycan-binding protein LysM [Mesonia aestuariivivens]|uniref:Peptidoglycan-binding protein LysM n=1 Tax=Mesonia aestuariivivens TaxID=2796128 RepID=A0ABS6W123_9FLAO|nr:peptidoglycan-binding protein LysM [Mesonia aestuariivivens]MBW2961211.1 peptidoglycan-binding protein LysM [Mesonia aestuariivivens]
MRRSFAKIIAVPVLTGIFLLSGFSNKEEAIIASVTTKNLPEYYNVKSNDSLFVNEIVFPVLPKNYLGFKEAVAFKESGSDYSIINQFGYLGKYQFGRGTLRLIGIYDTKDFLNNPKLQEAAFYANASRNKWILRRDLKWYVGRTIGGVKVTESGVLAAAHLAGPGSVKKFLRSGGEDGFSDAFGTSIKYYLNKFKGYDTSFVKPNRKAKATVTKLNNYFSATALSEK